MVPPKLLPLITVNLINGFCLVSLIILAGKLELILISSSACLLGALDVGLNAEFEGIRAIEPPGVIVTELVFE